MYEDPVVHFRGTGKKKLEKKLKKIGKNKEPVVHFRGTGTSKRT
jgi:hypothetical protein